MADAPSVLVIDDGELDGIRRMLKQLGADHVCLRGGEIRRTVDAPRDLLISAGRRTLGDMPTVAPAAGESPIWVCVHNQDFLPMRERLRDMGVDYLVHSALDEKSLRLLLVQLLFTESDRRASLRLPLGGKVVVERGGEREPARLAELSQDGCRIVTPRSDELGDTLVVTLPAVLGGGEELLLQAKVVRTAECQTDAGEVGNTVVLRFDSLSEDARSQLERICTGAQIGTRVSPLAAAAAPRADAEPGPLSRDAVPLEALLQEAVPPEAPASPAAEPAPPAERRGRERQVYERQVLVLGTGDPSDAGAILGRDLSVDGVRLTGCPPLAGKVSLALYSGRREEPLLVTGRILRSTPGDTAVQFDALAPSVRRQLEQLTERLPMLESLSEDPEQAGPVVIAQVRETA